MLELSSKNFRRLTMEIVMVWEDMLMPELIKISLLFYSNTILTEFLHLVVFSSFCLKFFNKYMSMKFLLRRLNFRSPFVMGGFFFTVGRIFLFERKRTGRKFRPIQLFLKFEFLMKSLTSRWLQLRIELASKCS